MTHSEFSSDVSLYGGESGASSSRSHSSNNTSSLNNSGGLKIPCAANHNHNYVNGKEIYPESGDNSHDDDEDDVSIFLKSGCTCKADGKPSFLPTTDAPGGVVHLSFFSSQYNVAVDEEDAGTYYDLDEIHDFAITENVLETNRRLWGMFLSCFNDKDKKRGNN